MTLVCKTLGVEVNASMSEVSAAYKQTASTHHPDKVAHLAPETREFADQMMKEINAAYAQLKRQRKLRPAASAGEPANGEEG